MIEEATKSVYLDAAIADPSGPRHRIFALSLNDGTPMPAWPIDVTDALRGAPQPSNSRDQNERGALQGPGVSCPSPAFDHQLTVIKIGAGDRPTITQAWCGKVSGAGSPIVTTSDGSSDPIV